jgi:large subunit ribosomal protein L21
MAFSWAKWPILTTILLRKTSMLAIVEISGEQFKIDSTTKSLRIPYMVGAEIGQAVKFDKVHLTMADNGKVAVGGKATISATVSGHTRGEKIIVFHKKRRKGYRKTNGHTPRYTEISIDSVSI